MLMPILSFLIILIALSICIIGIYMLIAECVYDINFWETVLGLKIKEVIDPYFIRKEGLK